jgi:hypothetical protein
MQQYVRRELCKMHEQSTSLYPDQNLALRTREFRPGISLNRHGCD